MSFSKPIKTSQLTWTKLGSSALVGDGSSSSYEVALVAGSHNVASRLDSVPSRGIRRPEHNRPDLANIWERRHVLVTP